MKYFVNANKLSVFVEVTYGENEIRNFNTQEDLNNFINNRHHSVKVIYS